MLLELKGLSNLEEANTRNIPVNFGWNWPSSYGDVTLSFFLFLAQVAILCGGVAKAVFDEDSQGKILPNLVEISPVIRVK